MRIKRVSVDGFASGEHRGLEVESIDGGSLLLRGGSRTGKTLTFNAIIYNLLGAQETIDLATGRQNEVEIKFTDGKKFFRGNPEADYDNGEEGFSGSEASDKFADDLGETKLVKSHFAHSHIGKMPLDDLSRSQRISLIRSVTNKELEQRLTRLQDAEAQLNQLVIEAQDTRRRVSEKQEDIEQQISSLESQKKKYQQLQEQISSGELAALSEQLKRDEELEERLDNLFKEKESLRKRLRKLNRKKRKQQNYESEVTQIIAEAVNDFVCPTCDRRITTEKAKNRIDRGYCPYCGREHSLKELKYKISEKINQSDGLLEELESEIDESQERRSEINDQVKKIQEQKPEIENLDGFVKRRLDNYDHDIDRVKDHVAEELEGIVRNLDKLQSRKEDIDEKFKQTDQKAIAYSEALESTTEKVEELTEKSFDADIKIFAEAWEEAYNQMNSNLDLEINMTEEGDIRFPGQNNLREYDRGGNLSGSELHLLNISFVCTLSQFATENDALDLDTLVFDEPFSNLQEEDNLNAALDYLLNLEKQLIITTSNESLDSRFDNVKILEREPLQSRISDFV